MSYLLNISKIEDYLSIYIEKEGDGKIEIEIEIDKQIDTKIDRRCP